MAGIDQGGVEAAELAARWLWQPGVDGTPTAQASLSMLTESGVTTTRSAWARKPA